jgi:hypothetical protein
MLRLPLALAAAALLAAPLPSGNEGAWQLLLDLDNPLKAEAAEKALEAGGGSSLPLLLRTARAAGDGAVLSIAARSLGCYFFLSPLSGGFNPYGPPTRSSQAAVIAARIVAADRGLHATLLGSPDPFERELAIVTAIGDSDLLRQSISAVRDDHDQGVIVSAIEVGRHCSDRAPKGSEESREAIDEIVADLSASLQAATGETECKSAGFTAGPFLDLLLSGRVTPGGWSKSGNELSLTMGGSSGGVSASVECALALYDAAGQRGKLFPKLVEPIVELGTAVQRGEAAKRLLRDLDRFEAVEANETAAHLVIEGFTVPRAVTWDHSKSAEFIEHDLVEAAARQGNAEAFRAIEKTALCRGTFGGHGLDLIGYLHDREQTDIAARIAETCDHGADAAVAALVRAGDSRAPGLLARGFQQGSFDSAHLARAIRESKDPRILAEVRRLARLPDDPKDGELHYLRIRSEAQRVLEGD